METKDRIKIIIDNEELTQVEFADRAGIKAPTLSHVLTGRNNPSTEIIRKILSAFPHYNSDWLLTGTGDMMSDPRSLSDFPGHEQMSLPMSGAQRGFDFDIRSGEGPFLENQVSREAYSGQYRARSVGGPGNVSRSEHTQVPNPMSSPRRVTKIIVFYDDNTYDTFTLAEERKPK